MSGLTTLFLGLAYLGVACGLAIAKGGAAERCAAILLGGTWLLAIVARLLLGKEHIEYILLPADALLAVGLLICAIRFGSLWIAALMCVQSAAFTLHAAYLAYPPENQNEYIWMMNNLSGLALIILLIATLRAWWVRVRRRAAPLAALTPA